MLKQHFLTRDEFLDAMERMDKRFEAVDRRFEAVDKRFEALIKEMHDGFASARVAHDERAALEDKRFGQLMSALDSLKTAFGVPFEQFARNVVARVLAGEGHPGVVLQPVKLPDPAGAVFPATKDVQIDGLSDDPPVIMEATAMLQDPKRIDKFLEKKAFVERQHPGRQYRGFFVAATSALSQDAMADAIVRLKARGCELLNL